MIYRLKVFLLVALMLSAVIVDFASRAMSVMADSVFISGAFLILHTILKKE